MLRICVALVSVWLLAGCSGGIPGFKDANGWSRGDRESFLSIYREDPYLSACGLEPLYRQYQSSHDTGVLTRMLVGYAHNMAHSCIDADAFRAAQAARRAQGIKTYFAFEGPEVDPTQIRAQLKQGVSIEAILAPYLPRNPQFGKLLKYYRRNANDPRQRILRLNIERTKLMSRKGWENWIEVNVPEYTLRFFERGHVAMHFAVITGKPDWQTPIFSSTMKYIVLNPTWTMTSNIVREDLVQKVLRDPRYLKRHNMKVYDGYGDEAREIDPATIDWKKYAGKENTTPIPFRVVQGSSKRNALGTVKFMFPNRFSVYMHDTQTQSLFRRKNRAFSHGCIRLSRPTELLQKIAVEYASTSMALINKHKNNRKISYVNLQQPLPVHLVYQTAYVDGGLKFFDDPYGFDALQKVIH